MANINAKDGTGQNIFVNASGTGTALDPFIPANVPVNPSGVYVAPVTPADLNARVPSGLIVTPEGLRVNTGLTGLATQTTLEAVRLLLAGTLQTDKTDLSTADKQDQLITAVEAVETAVLAPTDISGSNVIVTGTLTPEPTPAHIWRSLVVSSAGDTTLVVSPGAGNRIVAFDLIAQSTVNGDQIVLIKRGASDTNPMRVVMSTRGDGISKDLTAGRELILAANTALVVNLDTASVPVSFTVRYWVEAI
jgi:hypothetical protein